MRFSNDLAEECLLQLIHTMHENEIDVSEKSFIRDCGYLMEVVKATIYRDGGVFEQDYKYGIAQKNIERIDQTNKTGTNINFTPDYNLFVEQEYEHEIISERLRELAYLNSGVKIILINKNTNNVARIPKR